MNNIDSKIKKLYFEIKTCLYNLGFELKSFEVISNLQKKYPDDLVIQFELAKDSVINSKPDVFKNILENLYSFFLKNRPTLELFEKFYFVKNYIKLHFVFLNLYFFI